MQIATGRSGTYRATFQVSETAQYKEWLKTQDPGQALEFLKKAFAVLNNGNHDNSDISTDYFDVGWYVNVRIGEWNKPYILEK